MASTRSIEAVAEAPTPMTDCPMTAALDAIGGKWSLICLYWLDTGTRRFNELRRLMPDISHKVLTETLRNLERERLILRTVHSAAAPAHVDYRISPYGESVRPLMHAVRMWGRAHLERKGAERGRAARASSPEQAASFGAV